MKNTKLLIAIIALTASTLSWAIGDLVRDVVSVPGRVIQGTGEVVGEVGRAITPTTKTGSVGEAIVQTPGRVVEGTGEVLQTTGEAITPGTDYAVASETIVVEETVEPTTTEMPITEMPMPAENEPMLVETAGKKVKNGKTKKMPVVSVEACPFGGKEIAKKNGYNSNF